MTIEQQYYGDVADQYDARRRHTRTRQAEDAAFAALMATASGVRTVLDIPCGTGRWIDSFRRAGISYTGVDISTDMLRHAGRAAAAAGDTTLVEGNCFTFLPAHPEAYDLVISTRFINWWDEDTAARILALLCGASRRYILLHIRVDENRAQRAFRKLLRYPERLRRALKRSRPAGLKAAADKNRAEITYHNRARMLAVLSAAGARLEASVVIRRFIYGRVEFWLIRKGAT